MSEEELVEYCKDASLEISNMQHTIDKLQQEKQQLKEQLQKTQFDLEYEKENLKFRNDYAICLEKQLQQKDATINNAIKRIEEHMNYNCGMNCGDMNSLLDILRGEE